MDIRLVKNEDIDKVKWNSCVHYANNGNIFGYKWYLDFVAKDWDALVEGDYESVFPLCWRTRMFNKKELYQPELMRELGLYSINALSQKRIESFIAAIPEEYRLVNIDLNERNTSIKRTEWKLTEKLNHQLLLMEPYEVLKAAYTSEVLNQLKKAAQANLSSAPSPKPELIADFYKKHHPLANERSFHALQRIMYNVLHRGWGFSSGVQDEKGELLAVNFFALSHNKIISLVPAVSSKGKEVGALALLFDLIIRTNATRSLIFDFNTQADDPLAIGLGARSNIYYHLNIDRRKWGIL